ncbi:MAG: hypothetical protein EOM72_02455 [Opitutae bacterium]|nr:hypothetical protein [Opitutae bacterium]
MKSIAAPVLLLAATLLCAGCVVQSLHPWLSAESRVAEPSLLGAWHEAESEAVAFFTESSVADCDYAVTLAGPNDLARFTANLHRLGDTLLLVVGPEAREDAGVYATRPAYLLFKAIFAGDSLNLHAINLHSFADRAAKSHPPLLPGGSPNDGYVLTGTTADSEAFARAQLADPEFFDEKPLYSFQKPPAAAPREK